MIFKPWMPTIILLLTFYVLVSNCNKLPSVAIKVCQKPISFNSIVAPKLVEIPNGSSVLLQCSYCDSNENEFGAKLWYYQKRGKNNKKQEVIPEMTNDNKKVKTYITPGHSLVLYDFHNNESGIYSCENFDQDDNFSKLIFILDVSSRHARSITGTKTKWLRFKRQKLDTINKPSNYSKNTKVNKLNRIYIITYCWEDWEPCAFYGRNLYRKRLGKCCLHPKLNETVFDVTPEMFIDQYDILCRSSSLYNIHPDISLLIWNLPDFNFFELCRSKNDTFSVLPKVRLPRTMNKIKIIVRKIPEYGHLALTCNVFPWSANIQWYKDNKLLNDTFRKNMDADEDPHLFIDTFNTLYILHATKNEHGIYICTSNGVTMQKFDVRVITSCKLLNQDFLRYSIYLAFVLSLTVTCYCAGICVAWHQRASFADPLHINSIGNN